MTSVRIKNPDFRSASGARDREIGGEKWRLGQHASDDAAEDAADDALEDALEDAARFTRGM